MEEEFIRERLQPGRLANGEVPHLPIGEPKHVLAARDAVITSLQRLSWLVQGAAGVTGIGSSSRVKFMIWHDSIRSLWIWQIGDHVADSCPWPIKGQKRPCPFDGGTKSIGYSRAAPCRKLVALPIFPGYPLIDQQCLLGVSTAREAPLDAKVGPERHYKNPFSSLRHAVIRRVEEIEYHVVFKTTFVSSGVAPLQPRPMFHPSLASLELYLGMSDHQRDVLEVFREGLPQKSFHIFDQNDFRLERANSGYRVREKVASILEAAMLPT